MTLPAADVLLTFFGIVVLLALSPGPDNLFVLTQSVQRGSAVGMAVVRGLCLGIGVHTLAVAAGLAAVLAASPVAFDIMKWCGAAYLVYLAWGAWRAPVDVVAPQEARPKEQYARLGLRENMQLMGRGMLMNLTNPKVLIFFLALLPQFADPARGSVSQQIVVLGLVCMLGTFLVFGAVAFFSGVFGSVLQRSAKAQRWLNRLAATVFVGLALRLAMTQK
ncbi:LysE family translocator [Comamonas halotolerans]|uniref:LysE family translocator n=1 Tax=Comamonas halotolerans TaxID=3041496 RepID=UPI0039B77918